MYGVKVGLEKVRKLMFWGRTLELRYGGTCVLAPSGKFVSDSWWHWLAGQSTVRCCNYCDDVPPVQAVFPSYGQSGVASF